MEDYFNMNVGLQPHKQVYQPIPERLITHLRTDEALIWIPENLSRPTLQKLFPTLSILENQLIKTDPLDTGMWIRTSIANEPPFLELSAKEFDYITRKMGVVPFSLEIYLYVQWFCKQTFGEYIDREYWTWLPKTRFDRSGLLMGGIDKLGQFDFHGWMPDFQASFCGGRYYYTADAAPRVASQVALEWEYDKRETSFKHWISKLEKHDEESKFAAYHLLRDFELMKLYMKSFEREDQKVPQDLVELHSRWSEQMQHQDLTIIHGLALEQVHYYHAMLNDLAGYIISGMRSIDRFVPYRIQNGLKNLRNYYLVVNRLTVAHPQLMELRQKLADLMSKIKKLATKTRNVHLIEETNRYFGNLEF